MSDSQVSTIDTPVVAIAARGRWIDASCEGRDARSAPSPLRRGAGRRPPCGDRRSRCGDRCSRQRERRPTRPFDPLATCRATLSVERSTRSPSPAWHTLRKRTRGPRESPPEARPGTDRSLLARRHWLVAPLPLLLARPSSLLARRSSRHGTRSARLARWSSWYAPRRRKGARRSVRLAVRGPKRARLPLVGAGRGSPPGTRSSGRARRSRCCARLRLEFARRSSFVAPRSSAVARRSSRPARRGDRRFRRPATGSRKRRRLGGTRHRLLRTTPS